MYADDTQIYLSFEPTDAIQDITKRIESCMLDIHAWMRANLLKVNESKTEVLFLRPKHRVDNSPDTLSISVCDMDITSGHNVRNLGVTFDTFMSMDKHVNNICRCSYGHLRNISRLRCYLTEPAVKSLVQALVISRIDYCNGLLYGLPKQTLGKLQRVQNAAARVITRTCRRDHMTPVLRELHWLPIERRCQYKILLFTYKALHGQAPAYINDMLQWYQPTRPLRSEAVPSLVVPKTLTVAYGRRYFGSAAPMLWNSLPKQTRCIDSLNTFKRMLKTHLFLMEY